MMDIKRYSDEDVKTELIGEFSSALDRVFDLAQQKTSGTRDIELELWRLLVAVGRLVIIYAFALRCRAATQRDLKKRGLSMGDVRLRLDRDYWANVQTTLGEVSFPMFAFRRSAAGAEVTNTPAMGEVVPYRGSCRSSELCLEWEVRLGSDHPFRQAQEALTYFTHGAAHVEDNAIARHMVAVANLVNRSWLYRPQEELQQILRERATRCLTTDLPLLFVSSDAHAQRRYVDETWDAQWKMANGIRVWCMDNDTGRVIHLGGEYTWGDHNEVKRAFEWLIDEDYLPRDGEFKDGLKARLVWLSDGMPWFEDDIVPLFDLIVVILDAYHVIDRLSEYATMVYGKGTKKALAWYRKALEIMGIGSSRASDSSKKRKGGKHAKKSEGQGRAKQEANVPEKPLEAYMTAAKLMEHVAETRPKTEAGRSKQIKLINYLVKNAYRMDYGIYRTHGYQIGSGAMEAMHRTAAHSRLKVSGARWLESTSQAIFNWRMHAFKGDADPGRTGL